MRIFAIDPGLGGAWASIVNGRPSICGDMPTSGDGSKRRVAAGVLSELMRAEHPDLCVVELVGARPGNGVSGMFRFGMAYGAAIAVAQINRIPLELVVPQVWKRHHRLTGQDKEASRQRCIDLVPHMTPWLSRKLDVGKAEAILIGLYGEATFASRVSAIENAHLRPPADVSA